MNKDQLKSTINADSSKIDYGISKLKSPLEVFGRFKRFEEYTKKDFLKRFEGFVVIKPYC